VSDESRRVRGRETRRMGGTMSQRESARFRTGPTRIRRQGKRGEKGSRGASRDITPLLTS